MNSRSSSAGAPLYSIEGPQTVGDIEHELLEIERRQPVRLRIPVWPSRWWFGGEASLVQLVATWGKAHPDATLVTHIKSDEDPTKQLQRLVRRPFGLAAVWMARDVTDVSGSRSLRREANRASELEIAQMGFDTQERDRRQPGLFSEEESVGPEVSAVGNRVYLASIDQHPRWRIPPCYFSSGDVRYREDFVALADSIARKATAAIGGVPLQSSVLAPVGAVIHELFKNTHDWARTDESGVPLLRSVRGLIAQGHGWGREEALAAVDGSVPVSEYLAAPAFTSPKGFRRFLELSVFDSGPGLARRWHADHPLGVSGDSPRLTPDDEYRACLECFVRWNSSTRAGHKGLGLHEVMETLSRLGSFFRVRTGRLSLYRDFVARPYQGETQQAGDKLLHDWTTQSSDLTPLAAVEGTLYTMLIPTGWRPA